LCRAGLVTHFHEKPSGARLDSMAHASKHATPDDPFEASMGIYVFKRDVLTALLQARRLCRSRRSVLALKLDP
jgi:ADP-glucose pyrophosphorylase